MPYRGNNYSFVIDSSFQPFSMQEMLVPFTAYKEAFEKSEEAYNDLKDKADVFKDLSNSLPEGSEARKIYEGYANDLNAQAADLANNGLTMGNRRALTGLKQRYQGEIGRLAKAQTALEKEKELKRQMNAKDPTMIWASENFNIDDYLDNNTPNLYGISGTELYTKAAAASQAASKRQFSVNGESKTMGDYYYDYVQRMGYNPETIAKFRQDMSAIPELQQAAEDILIANGVKDNLSGAAYEQARQQVINGLIDGAVYSEQHNLQRNHGMMTAAEQASDARARESLSIQRQSQAIAKEKWAQEKQAFEDERKLRYTFDENGNITGLNPAYINQDNYEMNPEGKWVKKTQPKQSQEEKQELSDAKKKGEALMKLDKGALAHNEGFDVTFGDNRHHYNYIGALSKHGGKWYHGALDSDNPGHNFPRAWGWGSTSNVENIWGNFSAEGSDSKDMRVLSQDEMLQLVAKDQDILDAIDKMAEESGIDPEISDIQLIEVPNEKGGGGQKGYLIAVH